MGRNYFENPSCNVAFERCIDVLAELIEKYSGKFAMEDIGHVPKSKLTVMRLRITIVSESEVAQNEDYNT